MLNFTRGWTETDCWNEIRDHFKRSATRKSAREPHEHTRGLPAQLSLLWYTRSQMSVRRSRRKASPPRGVILYSECTPGDVAFSEVIPNLRRESRTGKEEGNAFRELRSILKFEVHDTHECSNDKFAHFARKWNFVNIQLLKKGRC